MLPKHVKVFSTLDFKIKSPKENGQNFVENSLIKSRYFSKKTNLICLADDSGLEIILDKNQAFIQLGGWPKSDFKKPIKKVYKELKKDKNWRNKKKQVLFVCYLLVIDRKIACYEKLREQFLQTLGKKVLDMIQYLFFKRKKHSVK